VSWITADQLREQRPALPEAPFLRHHANARTSPEGSWLPAAACQACVGEPSFEPGESIWAALDVGGTESATALVWISESGQVGSWIETADDAILRAPERVRELRESYRIEEFIFDPWRAKLAALELEREGVCCVELPQTDVRMVPASARLRSAVVERRVVLPPDPELARHAANAVQRHGQRGWRLDKPDRASPIDAVVSLAMALDRMEAKPEPARVLGWV
jgi:phage terminase large subunit-like protein